MAATASQRRLPFHDFHNAVAGPALPLSRLSILALWRAAGRVPAPVGARALPPPAARRLFVSRALPGTGLLLRRLSWQPGPVSPRWCPECPALSPALSPCGTGVGCLRDVLARGVPQSDCFPRREPGRSARWAGEGARRETPGLLQRAQPGKF